MLIRSLRRQLRQEQDFSKDPSIAYYGKKEVLEGRMTQKQILAIGANC